VKHVLGDATYVDRILDAGACRDPKSPSVFLPGLSEHGYQRLIGCNLDEKRRVMERGIRYEPGDITSTTYPDGFFGFVACLSVIEHGVNEFKFLQEMSRIIKRGGKLFVSFDYWADPIDTGDRTAWGAPVRIFNADDVHAMVKYADGIGFQCAPYTLTCSDAVINCFGLNYTFFNLLLERR
jgi:SAM-dependent methyltransferase